MVTSFRGLIFAAPFGIPVPKTVDHDPRIRTIHEGMHHNSIDPQIPANFVYGFLPIFDLSMSRLYLLQTLEWEPDEVEEGA